jgi:hypothetical protein
MHISNAYTGSQNVADLTGFLCLPPLKNSSEQPQHAKFVEEINREGVYIHKLSTDLNSLSGQFKKLKENRIPTPATFVGVGIHRTYNHWRWKNTSGLVFSPESISLLSYKGDIASLRIPDGKTLSDFTSGSKHEQYEAYSRYLSKTFNSLKETITAFNNRKPKKLTLIENVDFAKEKYRELEVRSNFAFSKKEIVFENQTHDIASKYIICRILKNTGKLAHQWTRADLLTELTARCEKEEHLAEILKHAIIKIRLFHDDAALHLYLERGLEEPEKIGHYIEQTSKTGAQTPNEHLLMPTLEDIVGICVNFESVVGVDQAIEINRNLRAEQKDHGIGERNNPALLYQISMKRGKSLTRAGWSQHIMPWSSAGLMEFARTGKVKGIDGGTFTPKHFKAINLLAEIGAVVAFETDKNLHGCHAPQNFISDLSTVKENDEKLLHIALKAKCSTEIVNFFYFWKVDAFSERDQNGDTALEIAEREKHPSLEFLKLANGWSNQPAKIIENRNCYIAEQLKQIKKERLSFDLRNGNIETGETDYIQELRTYRVTNGKIRFGGNDDFVHRGVQLYDPETEDMNFVLGSRSFKDNFDAFGVWRPRANPSRRDPVLILGLKYHAPINVLPTQKSPETIVLVSNAGVIDH